MRQVRGFLGLCGFYSQYVRDFADIAAPLFDLLQKNDRFQWTSTHSESFEHLKRALLENVVLHIVRFDQPFFLRCDASEAAVGSVLEQHSGKGELRPVAFYSRKLTKGQHAWSSRESEMYAAVISLIKFASYIGTQPVTLLTDHRSLQDLPAETRSPGPSEQENFAVNSRTEQERHR